MSDLLDLSYQSLNQLEIEINNDLESNVDANVAIIKSKIKEYEEILHNIELEYKINKKDTHLKSKIEQYNEYINNIKFKLEKKSLTNESILSKNNHNKQLSTETKYVFIIDYSFK